MKENSLWLWLRRGLPPGAQATRIESSTARGIPDVEICLPSGCAGWVELKVAKQKSKGRWLVNISPQQIVWHSKRHLANGKSCFLVSFGQQNGRAIIFGQHAELLTYPFRLEEIPYTPITNALEALKIICR